MARLLAIAGTMVLLVGCGSGGSSSSNTPPPPPPPPLVTPAPVVGNWVIVTQSNVTPGLGTVANFQIPSVQSSNGGYQFGGLVAVAVTPLGNFGWPYPQCPGMYGIIKVSSTCPSVTVDGTVGVGTYNGVNITIAGSFPSTSNNDVEQAVFSGTISGDGTTMAGTFTATNMPAPGQTTQTDSGNFFAAVLEPTSVSDNYVGTVAIENCAAGGVSCSAPQDVNLSLNYSGTLGSPEGSVQFTVQGNTYTASLSIPSPNTAPIGGLFDVGLSDSNGTGAGTFDFVPGVNFTVPPAFAPSSDAMFVNFSVPNGTGSDLYVALGSLSPGTPPTGGGASIGAASSFTYNVGVIAQVPLVTFGPATPTASTSFCTSGCSQLSATQVPISLSVTISQPVAQGQGYLRVFVLDTSAPATNTCSPSTQISACSFTNYPGNGIYIGDFNPGGGYTLQGSIPAGNTIQPTDNLEVVIVNPAGSWTGTVNWQLNYQ